MMYKNHSLDNIIIHTNVSIVPELFWIFLLKLPIRFDNWLLFICNTNIFICVISLFLLVFSELISLFPKLLWRCCFWCFIWKWYWWTVWTIQNNFLIALIEMVTTQVLLNVQCWQGYSEQLCKQCNNVWGNGEIVDN